MVLHALGTGQILKSDLGIHTHRSDLTLSMCLRCRPNYESSTKTVYKDLNPTFDEFFEVGNLPAGTSVLVEVRTQHRMHLS
jgi:hypothetical protein